MSRKSLLLWIECAAFFVAVPIALAVHPTRLNGHLCLWLFSLYAVYRLTRMPGFSWRNLWHGKPWSWQQKKQALLRFIAATPMIVILTALIAPWRLFSFPLQRPGWWVIVMLLYPILSALPQELVLRSFFFRRYAKLLPGERMMIAANAIIFALIHVMFHNFVSPSLCLIGGALFALSYTQHRSLKWAAIEHAAYGCMIFTCGIGFYFLVAAPQH